MIAPDDIELRVVGCLVEKQRTTPDQYPLTLNSLRLACYGFSKAFSHLLCARPVHVFNKGFQPHFDSKPAFPSSYGGM